MSCVRKTVYTFDINSILPDADLWIWKKFVSTVFLPSLPAENNVYISCESCVCMDLECVNPFLPDLLSCPLR